MSITRPFSLLSVAFVVLFLAAPAVKADEIALWNFNDAVTAGPPSLTVDRGTGLLTTTANPADLTHFTGTTVNAQMGDPAGRDLAIVAGTNQRNNGSILDLRVNTAGFTGITISWAWQASSTGFNSTELQYSVDGTNFISLGVFDPPASFALFSYTFADPNVANNPNFAFRWILGGATGSAGNIRFDNLLVAGTASAVPEPTTLLLLGTGLAGVVARVRRRRRAS